MPTIPELQQELQRRQAAALNSIYAAHKASLEAVLDLTEREQAVLSDDQKNREWARARAEILDEAVTAAKAEYLAAESTYYVQEVARVTEIMATLFSSAADLPPTEIQALISCTPDVLDKMLDWALNIGDRQGALHILYASHLRGEDTLGIQMRWKNEVEGGSDDLAMLGELSMVRGSREIEDRLRDAELTFGEVAPSWSIDQLMPRPGESVRVA